ncbi:MAG TPA: ferritin family protein [Geobacteraceae bacterium]|nr:ferritin family protein [Geobacteraceae bacterium]
MNVFDFAIKMEDDGGKFYEKLAAEADDPELKMIFSLLAEEELQHRNIFQSMKDGEDPAQADSRIMGRAKSAFQKLLDKKDMSGILRSDPDAYLHSIKTEEEYIRLYEDMANREKSPHVKELLLRIAEEERHHLKIMEHIYDFVESPRNFLAWGEFSNLRDL